MIFLWEAYWVTAEEREEKRAPMGKRMSYYREVTTCKERRERRERRKEERKEEKRKEERKNQPGKMRRAVSNGSPRLQ